MSDAFDPIRFRCRACSAPVGQRCQKRIGFCNIRVIHAEEAAARDALLRAAGIR